MNKLAIGLLIFIILSGIYFLNPKAFLSSGEMTNEKKAETCPEGKQKYYSIIEESKCGESCQSSQSAFIAKVFARVEMNLAKDKNCDSLGYKKYVGTQSNGLLFLKSYVDIYSKE